MSDATALKRQLTIKTGVVKRLTKEEKTYVQEAAEQAARVERFLAEGRDEWDIKKQREVYDDCAKMIPDCKTRLERALEDLDILLEGLDDQVEETDEATAAREASQAAHESLSSAA